MLRSHGFGGCSPQAGRRRQYASRRASNRSGSPIFKILAQLWGMRLTSTLLRE